MTGRHLPAEPDEPQRGASPSPASPSPASSSPASPSPARARDTNHLDDAAPTQDPLQRPWARLERRLASALAPSLPSLADEVIAEIGRAIPEYRRPLQGAFGEGLRTGVQRTLQQFIELVGRSRQLPAASIRVYRELGRGELSAGRRLDALQAAYRLGARVAWRRLSSVAREHGADASAISLLAESLFAYIDEVAAISVEGYAEAQADVVGELERRRRRAMRLLLQQGERSVDPLTVQTALQEAGWSLPPSAAALVCDLPDVARLTTSLGPGSIGARLDELTCLLVDLRTHRMGERQVAEALLRAARDRWSAALGPTVPAREVSSSFAIARQAFELQRAGLLPGGFLRVEDHLLALLLHREAALIGRLARARFQILDAMPDAKRERLERTLLSWLRHRGSIAAVADELHVHRQTVRYRLARLRELFRSALEDPEARLEIELALRARSVSRQATGNLTRNLPYSHSDL